MRRRQSTPKGRRAGRGRLGARGQRAARVALGRRVPGRGRGRGSSEGAGGPQPAEVWLPRLPRGAAEARPQVGGGARGPGGRTGDADVTCRAAGWPLLVPASASARGCDAPSWPACDSEGPMGRRGPRPFVAAAFMGSRPPPLLVILSLSPSRPSYPSPSRHHLQKKEELMGGVVLDWRGVFCAVGRELRKVVLARAERG